MNYYESQFFKVAPYPVTEENSAENKNGVFCIQLRSWRGKTNFMDITPEQFKQIEEILTKEGTA
jgi:hypothetical protein